MPDSAQFPTVLNERYRLVRVVGRGGMATVFEADDIPHQRRVAIKFFRGDVGLLGGAERFAREIAILATLQHPNILPLLDSGTADGRPYFVMPYVAGESLRERLNVQGPLEPSEVVRYLIEVGDAMRHAHEQGFVHRDLKPENVLLSGRHAVVSDFGIARIHAPDYAGDTTGGMAIGTPAYMAPEQATADPSADAKADIYSLGIVAYELLAGHPPFSGRPHPEILAAHVNETPPPLRELRPDLSPGLADLVHRCLAKRPADRPSAGELVDLLEAQRSSSGALTPPQRAPVAPSRRPLFVALVPSLGAVALLLLLLARRGDGDPTVVTATTRLSEGSALELDPAPSPDGRFIAYATGTNGSLRVMLRQPDGPPIAIADSVGGNQRAPQWTPDGNRIWFQANGSLYLAAALPGKVERVVAGAAQGNAEHPAPSPDGQQLAYTQRGEIVLMTLADRSTRTLVRDPEAHSLAWSPDGSQLAYVSGNADFAWSATLLGNVAPSALHVLRVTDGRRTTLTSGAQLATSPAWLDDRTLVFVQGTGGFRDVFLQPLHRSGLPDGNAVRLTTGMTAHSVRPTHDGRALLVATLNQSSNLFVASIDGPLPTSVRDAIPVTRGRHTIEDVDVHPVMGWLAFDNNLGGNQDLFVQPLGSPQPIQLTSDTLDQFGPAWSPNGRELAYYSVRNGVRHIFVMRMDERRVTQVTRDSLGDHQPRWAPDGEQLVFYRRDGVGQDHPYIVRRHPDSTWSASQALGDEIGRGTSWSPDGRMIAYSNNAGEIRVHAIGGLTWTVARPADVGGLLLSRPTWLPGGLRLLARAVLPGGLGAIWEIAIDGGTPREVLRFDDPTRPVYRDDFASDGRRIYFTVVNQESGLVRLDLNRRDAR